MLTQEKLKSILKYDKDTGVFTWLIRPTISVPVGSIAGYLDKSVGYIKIGFNRKNYLAHRLAWLYCYGEWPENQIDHINHNRIDNRICNLRDVDDFGNRTNTSIYSKNKSGVHGVTWRANRWESKISFKGVTYYLGRFVDIGDAIEARKNAESNLDFHKNHGAEL